MRPLTFVAYAPALVAGDARSLSLIRAMEDFLPYDKLVFSVSESNTLQRIENRDAMLDSAARYGKIPFLCNGVEGRLVSVSGYSTPPKLGQGGQSVLDVAIMLPEIASYVKLAGTFLLRTCERLRSFWAVGSPKTTAAQIGAQTTLPGNPHQPPLGLPPLLPSFRLPDPFIPQRLGWLNYWSAKTTMILGFPDSSAEPELVARSQMGSDGGWVVKLTESPLDLSEPTHLAVLRKAYDRFPAVGGRQLPP